MIQAGEFEMGSNSGNKDEKPAHRVYLDGFYIDKFEVTVALYTICHNSGKCKKPIDGEYYNWGEPNRSNVLLSVTEYIGNRGDTWGSETSQYPEEKKSKEIP